MIRVNTGIILFLSLLFSFGMVLSPVCLQCVPQALGYTGDTITANFSAVPVTLDGTMSEAEWSDAEGVDFASAGEEENVSFRIKYDPTGEWIYLVFSVPDTTPNSFDMVAVFFDMNHNGALDIGEYDYTFFANRWFGLAIDAGWNGTDWDFDLNYPKAWEYAITSSNSSWVAELKISAAISDNERWGIALLQCDDLIYIAWYPSPIFNLYQPNTWAEVVFSKQRSSITVSLSKTSMVIGDSTTVTATLSPTRSTGTVTLSYSKDGGPWATMASGSPSDGVYSYTWSPTAAGTYQVKASWSGDEVYRESMSSLINVTVTKGYTFTFDSSPRVSSIIVDDATYAATDLPSSFTWQEGSTHTFSIPNIIVEGPEGVRYVFTHWNDGSNATSRNITVTANATYTAQFKTQYYLTVNSPYGDPQGEGWYDSEATASFSVTSPIDQGNQTKRIFTVWSGDSTSESTSDTILMDGPKKLAAHWKTQYYLKVISSYGDPRGDGWYDVGVDASFTVASPIDQGNQTRRVFTTWSGDSTSESTSDTILIDGPKTVTAEWKTQYYLKVVSSYGDPKGEGWHDAGVSASFSVTSPIDQGNQTRRVLTTWSGDSTSATPSASITIDAPKTVTAEWKTQYYLTVDANGGEVSGEGWYDAGSEATAVATSPAKVVEDRSRLVFTGWSGDVVSEESRVSLTVNKPYGVTANWKKQFYLKIDPKGGEVSQTSQWLDSGASINIEATSPCKVVPKESRLVFIGWSGTTPTIEKALSITMDTEKTFVANWKTQYYLKVQSEYGEPQGEGWHDEGASASFSVQSPVGMIIQQAFTGWSGDSQATTSTASITMDSAKTVTATWRTDYTQLIIIVAVVVVAAVGGTFATKKRKKK